MASRTVYQGDTYPPIGLSVADATGVKNLTAALAITCVFVGRRYTFEGAGVAVWPAEPDASGLEINVTYALTALNTANVDRYAPFVVVNFGGGEIETFACADVLYVARQQGPQ